MSVRNVCFEEYRHTEVNCVVDVVVVVCLYRCVAFIVAAIGRLDAFCCRSYGGVIKHDRWPLSFVVSIHEFADGFGVGFGRFGFRLLLLMMP